MAATKMGSDWMVCYSQGYMDLRRLREGRSGLALSVGKMHPQLVLCLNVDLGRKRYLRVGGRAIILVTLDMNYH